MSIEANTGPARLGWALFGLAAALRLIGGAWAPWHVNGLGSDWLLRAWQPVDGMSRYGPGYPELFGLPVAALPFAPDHALFLCNVLLGAALAPLLYLLGRQLGLGWKAAGLVGLLVAVDPLSVQMGASEAYHPAMLAGRHAAEVLFLLAITHLGAGRRARGLALGVCGLLAACLTARVHPVGWTLAAGTPAVLLAWPGASPLRRLGAAVGAAVALGLLAVATGTVSASSLAEVLGGGLVSDTGGVGGLARGVRPSVLLAGGLFGAALSIRRGRSGLFLALPTLVSVLAAAMTWRAFTQSDVWLASYLRLWMGLPLIGLVALVEPELERLTAGRRAAALAAVAVVALGGLLLAKAAPPTTEQQEYRWLRPILLAQPSGCELRWLHRAERRWMSLPWHLLPDAAEPHRLGDGWAWDGLDRCVLYMRSSLCSSQDGRAECDALERQAVLQEVARTTLSARASYADLPYDVQEVEVVLFRALGPSALSPARPAPPGCTPSSEPTL